MFCESGVEFCRVNLLVAGGWSSGLGLLVAGSVVPFGGLRFLLVTGYGAFFRAGSSSSSEDASSVDPYKLSVSVDCCG